VSNAAWSADGSTIATGASGPEVVRLWSATTGKEVGRLDKELSYISGLVYSKRTADILVFGNEASLNFEDRAAVLRWHDAATGKLTREHRLGGKAWRFAPSPDESRMAVETYQSGGAGAKAALQIIDAQTGNVISSVAIAPESTETLAWAPDAKSLYQVTSKGLTQLEVGTGRVLLDKALPHFRRNATTGMLGRGRIWCTTFFEDAHEVLTTGSLPEIYAWSTITGELRWSLPTGKLFIRGLALSPDESLVACIDAVGDTDTKTLRLFQIVTKRELAHFDLGRENCHRIVFSQGGNRILVGFYDGTALVYDVSAALNKVE
jgi:WD40 repeat protein